MPWRVRAESLALSRALAKPAPFAPRGRRCQEALSLSVLIRLGLCSPRRSLEPTAFGLSPRSIPPPMARAEPDWTGGRLEGP